MSNARRLQLFNKIRHIRTLETIVTHKVIIKRIKEKNVKLITEE